MKFKSLAKFLEQQNRSLRFFFVFSSLARKYLS